MSWPAASVRGSGRDQSRASSCRGLVASLTRHSANFVRFTWREREANKHVESFGVGFWIRVQFSAPPPYNAGALTPLTTQRHVMSTTTQTHLMTAEELGNLDDDYHRHELIKGELLTMPPVKYEHMRVSANLTMLLLQHVKANRLGIVGTEGGYKIESD